MATKGPIAAAPIAEVLFPKADFVKPTINIKTKEILCEDELGFNPAELQAKYLDERDRRLARNEGVEQYRLLDDSLSHYLRDPWVESDSNRDSVQEETEVLIIGGGYGAQVCAVRLIEAGVEDFKIVEKGGDFGGTWYWNRYPGAQCDVDSYIYMPLLEEIGYMPTEKYARAKELLGHSRKIGEKYDLYSRTLFQTECKEVRWSEEEGVWTTRTAQGDNIKSRFVVSATGLLHRPKLPGLEGIEEFKGHSFHSSRWDYAYTGGDSTGNLHNLKDKRVGIIGTGATAVQIVPHLGEWAKHLYVFQRTPSSVDVRDNRPTDEAWAQSLQKGWQKKRMDNFDNVVNGGYEEEDMVSDRWTDAIRSLLAASIDPSNPVEAATKGRIVDFKKMNAIRARTDEIVQDKRTADALKPWYNQFCKRPCFHDEYLPTFNRPNVTLVDTKGQGADRITPNGVVANGQEYELDCLIYATGFELMTEWSHRSGIEIYGRNDLTITEKWAEGAQTLHGWGTNNFPNCLFVQIMQAAVGPNVMHLINEQAIHYAYIISECRKRGMRTIEPTQEAEEEWTKTIVQGTAFRDEFRKGCTPGYYNNEGCVSEKDRKNGPYGYGSPAFIKILNEWREEGGMKGTDITFAREDASESQGRERDRFDGERGTEQRDNRLMKAIWVRVVRRMRRMSVGARRLLSFE